MTQRFDLHLSGPGGLDLWATCDCLAAILPDQQQLVKNFRPCQSPKGPCRSNYNHLQSDGLDGLAILQRNFKLKLRHKKTGPTLNRTKKPTLQLRQLPTLCPRLDPLLVPRRSRFRPAAPARPGGGALGRAV